MKNLFISSILALTFMALLGLNVNVYAQGSVVVPNANSDMSGLATTSGFGALNCSSNGADGIRIQTVYPAKDLQGGAISAIAYRLSPESPDSIPAGEVPNVTIKMSTTEVSDLVPEFADNIGPDERVVFQGTVPIAASDCDTDPCPFTLPIQLQSAFAYNPENGNLLVEFMVPECVGGLPSTVRLDGALDNINTVNARGMTVDSEFAFSLAGFLLIAEFTYAPRSVPTLSEWGLIALAATIGIVGFIVVRRRTASQDV